MVIRRGDIFYADLRPVVGSEQGGVRPVLIIQNDVGNRHSPTVICAAITSQMNKAKLPIARVFLKNPPILIFDEATSALDNESEKVVQDSLEKLAKNRTTFVIAHRLSTIKNAEKILVLTENGIEEEGTHEELLAKKGIYEKLYHMQFQKQ